MLRISIYFAAFMFFLLTPARAEQLDYLQSAKADAYFRLDSEQIGRPFHIFVRLPEDYLTQKGQYPVIYLLDGGTNYPLLTSYYSLLSIDEVMPDAIIVGISYGGSTFEEGNYRSTDYTAPSPEREFWGGAEAYQNFLESELIPVIEDKYRADKLRRILFGQSLAGQFVIYSALTNPDLFWGRIASNPAFHRNLDYFLKLQPEPAQTSPRLLIASGSNDDERFLTPRSQLLEHWRQNPPPWSYTVETLEGEYHASAAPLAFRAGMRWLFPANAEPGK